MRILIAFNPTSGTHSVPRLDALVAALAALGHTVEAVDAHDPSLQDQVARAERLVVAGGDGTARDVVARLTPGTQLPPIAVFPAGTINLLAREAGYDRDVARFARRLCRAGERRRHFVARIGAAPFLVCASVGPDAEAVAAVNSRAKRRFGRYAYALAFARLILAWPRRLLSVSIDGRHHTCEAAFVLKGRFYAGPWSLAPAADVTAPELRLLLLPRARRRDYLRLFAAAMLSRRLADPAWIEASGRDVEISEIGGSGSTGTTKPLSVQADGDIAATLPVRLGIREPALAFA
jgi:diacylglycerol kinase family enzyme